jgi:hypothetical protein
VSSAWRVPGGIETTRVRQTSGPPPWIVVPAKTVGRSATDAGPTVAERVRDVAWADGVASRDRERVRGNECVADWLSWWRVALGSRLRVGVGRGNDGETDAVADRVRGSAPHAAPSTEAPLSGIAVGPSAPTAIAG